MKLYVAVPSEGRDDQFYDLSSQESDKLVDNSEPVKCLYRDAVSEKANIESMMSRIRKICESKGKTKKNSEFTTYHKNNW